MVKTCSLFNMKFLFLFLFFGIIYANKDKSYTNQELTKLVNDLSNKLDQLMKDQKVTGNVDDLQSEIDEMKSNLTSQESRIQANEAKIETNHDSIAANAEDIQTNKVNIIALNFEDLQVHNV